ncbi:Meiotic nuclear division protein 1 homolog [Seminavis robusta]|uniref:Meiotic nuclear division protein 1 homolog n=1 Tax=Seminavis robusta TaxID=568900 RepID=A0A9N8ETS7_9STRA|nr:Meiotic nuclear division protein 1 homolog [Seminavis robusta]|eukprot:Sro2127_g315750.1 Meiotic nuclear division protein 1 homolog (212) ;mRNA; f:8549-9377
MGGKRMSKEEKRQAMLGIYHKSKQVYTENEILKLASKEGITGNEGVIKDIHNSLIDDNLVEKSKIGQQNFFWSFPAKKQRMAEIQLKKTEENIEVLKVKVEEAKARLTDAKRGREDDDGERSKKLARLTEIGKERQALETELAALKESDPQAIADLEKELNYVTQAANRWTDNIYEAHSFLVKKKGMEKKQANRMLGITDAFDYPEDKIPK